jgi:hypothetical protein
MCRASAMTEQDLALGLSRMVRVFSRLATLEGTGATCIEVGMGGRKNRKFWWIADERDRTKARILDKCVQNGDCVEWMGPFNGSGYGITTHLLGGARKTGRTHRIMWEIEHGPIPAGLVVDHVCRNRKCLNTSHLRIVTPYVNSVENNGSPIAVHAQKENCPRCGGDFTLIRSKHRARGVYRECKPCSKEKDRIRAQSPERKRIHAARERERKDRLRQNPEWVQAQKDYIKTWRAKRRSAHFTLDDVTETDK